MEACRTATTLIRVPAAFLCATPRPVRERMATLIRDTVGGLFCRVLPRVVCVAAAVLALGGCESDINPIVGSDMPFTMWGFMNAGADTQYIRVYPISGELITERSSEIDAEVFSTDLTTGEKRQWSYEKVQFDGDVTGHVFWSPFRAVYEHRYHLEVVRSDGEASEAKVTVPAEADFSVEVQDGKTVFVVRIQGEIPTLIGLKVTYNSVNVPPTPRLESDPIHPPVLFPVTVSYDDEVRRDGQGWHMTVDLVRDESLVRSEFRDHCLITPTVPNIWLQSIEFTAVAADSSWRPPGGTFDPNVLVVPGTMSNVENGYGFIGGGEGMRILWTPTVEARLLAGYRAEPTCQSGPEPEKCVGPTVAPVPCFEENAIDIWRRYLR